MEARLAQPRQQLPLALDGQRTLVGHRVYKGGEVAVRRDGGVLLAEAPRRGVARVRERLLAVRHGGRVERVEAALGHVHLAAQLNRCGCVAQASQRRLAQAQRHVLHRAHVGGDVLARGAIAARRRAHEAPVLVRQGDGRAVDLELAHHRHHAAERLRHALDPRVQLLQVHGVVERVHAPRMPHRGELLAHVAADALRGARRVHELGVGRLQLAQLAHERVERGIGYLGRVVGVVQVAVMLDLAPKRVDARRRIARRLGERPLVQEVLLFVCHVLHRRLAFLHREEGPERIRGLRHFIEILPRVAAGSAPAPWFHQRLRQRPRPGYASMALFAFQP